MSLGPAKVILTASASGIMSSSKRVPSWSSHVLQLEKGETWSYADCVISVGGFGLP